MDFRAIFNLFLIIGVIQGFVFIGASFFLRRKIEKTVLFLNLFVLFLTLNNLNAWLIDKGFLGTDAIAKYLTIPWYLMIVPMFYAFLVHYLCLEDKKWPFFRISAVLFFLALISRFLVIHSVQSGSMTLEALRTYNLAEDALAFVYSLFLYVKSIRLLTKYAKLYPNILAFDNLKWIRQFLRLGALLFLLWLIAVLLNSFSDLIRPPYSYYPLRLASSILIYWVGYQAFYRYVILRERIGLRTKLKNKEALNSNRLKGKIPNQRDVFEQIHAHVIAKKSYLNPVLGMELLSSELNMGTSTLSKHINENFEGNFSEYINQFRVEEAKRVLIDPAYENYTIVAIGLECGFNSKSTFYTAFKKYTGVTPSAFRKTHSSK